MLLGLSLMSNNKQFNDQDVKFREKKRFEDFILLNIT